MIRMSMTGLFAAVLMSPAFSLDLDDYDGLARTIYPAHTPSDGDTIFALALGNWEGAVSLSIIGALAADAVSDAILSAVAQAEGLPGLPAASDLDP